MAYRKWKETKVHPGTARPGNMLGCSLVSFHFLWAFLCTQAVEHQSQEWAPLTDTDSKTWGRGKQFLASINPSLPICLSLAIFLALHHFKRQSRRGAVQWSVVVFVQWTRYDASSSHASHGVVHI